MRQNFLHTIRYVSRIVRLITNNYVHIYQKPKRIWGEKNQNPVLLFFKDIVTNKTINIFICHHKHSHIQSNIVKLENPTNQIGNHNLKVVSGNKTRKLTAMQLVLEIHD